MTSDTVWDIPEPISVHDVRVDEDTVITLRRHGNSEGPRLVMSHGNGLAIDLYYPFWSLLADDFDLIVYDLRNHGWNGVSTIERHNVPTFVDDHDQVIEAIDSHFGDKPKVGVFHSVSALVTLLSPTRGSEYSARVLFDPPLCKPGRNLKDFEDAAIRLSAITRRRTETFKSREHLSGVLPYVSIWEHVVPGVHELYARTTLRERNGEPGFELRCPREYEAQVVDYASTFGVLVDFDSLVCPTKVIGADPTLPYSYLPTLDLSDVFTVGYDFIPDATHFLQLEQPEECVELLREFIAPIIGS